MNKCIISVLILMLLGHTPLYAQRICGDEMVNAGLIARDPGWVQRLSEQKASLQGKANNYRRAQQGARKTTAASAVPVIFHVMIKASHYALLGGDAGILQRITSQIQVLNEDYNRQNADSGLIPSGWKPLYGNAGIHFGLAHTTPAGFGTPGYELSIIPDAPGGFFVGSDYCSSAKHESSGGLNAWDITKYLNIWVVSDFVDYPGLLGLTVAKSKTGGTGFPINDAGVVVSYLAVGKRTSWADTFYTSHWSGGIDHFDRGRTLTHEIGHFFEIWHTWGDDFGACPWGSGGDDDGLADTPPEGDRKYHSFGYDVPGGTYRDSCHIDTGGREVQPYGCATLDFMNYTDDSVMQLFTNDQAAVMASMVAMGGESYAMTQHPELLEWSPRTAVAQLNDNQLTLSPNPTTGIINITFDNTKDELEMITVMDAPGKLLQTIKGANGSNLYTINLAGMNKGIYFVRCTFASGNITRKIVLQ